MNARVFGRPAQRQPKTGDHFVKDQKRPRLLCDLSQERKKSRLWRHHTHIGRHRLHHHCRHLTGIFLHQPAHGLCIIVDCRQRTNRVPRRYARTVRHRLCHQPGTGLHQQAVRMAVIVTGEFDDLVPAGKSSGHAHGTHHRLGSGTDQTHHLHIRHTGADPFRQLHFSGCRRSETQPAGTSSLYRLHHSRMRMSQNARPPGTDIIQIPVPVRIEKPGTLRPFHEEGLSAHGPKSPHR